MQMLTKNSLVLEQVIIVDTLQADTFPRDVRGADRHVPHPTLVPFTLPLVSKSATFEKQFIHNSRTIL